MKKYLFIVFLMCLIGKLFSDVTKELESSEDTIKKMYIKVDNLSKQKKYPEALKICNKIEHHFEARYKNEKDILSAVLLTRAYIVKSKVFRNMNNLKKAVDLTRKAVELYEKFPFLKQSIQYPKLKALLKEREIILTNHIFQNVAGKAHLKEQQNQVEIQLISAVHILESHKPLNVYNLGLAYFCLWECKKTFELKKRAKKYLSEALDVKEASNYFNTQDPGIYSMLGELSLSDKEYKASIVYYSKFLKISKKIKLDVNLVKTYRNLSIAYSKEEDYKKAIIYIKKSLDQFPVIENLHQQINCAGLSLFHILFLYKNKEKEEAQIQLNKLKIQLSKLPQDNKTVKRVLKQCVILQEKLDN